MQTRSFLGKFFVFKAALDVDNKTKTQAMMNLEGSSKTYPLPSTVS